uniref:GYF domain-containing protein n=1 Tax=Tetraselmis sp. GSL018 TaxID=582737 RepID=A0A061RUI2_9CHLO
MVSSRVNSQGSAARHTLRFVDEAQEPSGLSPSPARSRVAKRGLRSLSSESQHTDPNLDAASSLKRAYARELILWDSYQKGKLILHDDGEKLQNSIRLHKEQLEALGVRDWDPLAELRDEAVLRLIHASLRETPLTRDVEWFFHQNGHTQGPFTLAGLQVLLNAGIINKGSHVWPATYPERRLRLSHLMRASGEQSLHELMGRMSEPAPVSSKGKAPDGVLRLRIRRERRRQHQQRLCLLEAVQRRFDATNEPDELCCPSDEQRKIWTYVDEDGVAQGPFSLAQLRVKHEAGELDGSKMIGREEGEEGPEGKSQRLETLLQQNPAPSMPSQLHVMALPRPGGSPRDDETGHPAIGGGGNEGRVTWVSAHGDWNSAAGLPGRRRVGDGMRGAAPRGPGARTTARPLQRAGRPTRPGYP